jgi:phage baseplate assembly protein W
MFQPEFGSNIRALLFEQMNPITEERIKTEVENAVRNHEPRAEILGITVESQEEQNRYLVSILFNVTSEAEPQKLETYFDKV